MRAAGWSGRYSSIWNKNLSGFWRVGSALADQQGETWRNTPVHPVLQNLGIWQRTSGS